MPRTGSASNDDGKDCDAKRALKNGEMDEYRDASKASVHQSSGDEKRNHERYDGPGNRVAEPRAKQMQPTKKCQSVQIP